MKVKYYHEGNNRLGYITLKHEMCQFTLDEIKDDFYSVDCLVVYIARCSLVQSLYVHIM